MKTLFTILSLIATFTISKAMAVGNYIDTKDDFVVKNYCDRLYIAEQAAQTDSLAGEHLIDASNRFAAMVVTPLVTSVVVSAIILGGGPVLAAAILSVVGTGVSLMQMIKFIIALKDAGIELKKIDTNLIK